MIKEAITSTVLKKRLELLISEKHPSARHLPFNHSTPIV